VKPALADLLTRHWYRPAMLVPALLLPFSLLFALIGAIRRELFRKHILRSQSLPVPVVVVGNLTAGGAGKTPLTIALAQSLSAKGWKVGIISRGYGGQNLSPRSVEIDSDPAQSGDEPILLRRATGMPVFVCRDRYAAGAALLEQHPDVNLLLCDDGLQHYRLARDLELCVIDGARGLGNRLLLPSGPLREPVYRLDRVDALVMNGQGHAPEHAHIFQMQLQAGEFYRLCAPEQHCLASDLHGQKITALCGIGNPQRFFKTLRDLGLAFTEQAMPDHHVFSAADLPTEGLIVVTEKDAVKLAHLPECRGNDRIRVLPVSATICPDLAGWITERLNHGRQAA
jgi:tetraacyldisaccharide 4'-kinase